MPHQKLDKAPYELWKGHAPNLKYLKVCDYLAKVRIPDGQRTKIGPKIICLFI